MVERQHNGGLLAKARERVTIAFDGSLSVYRKIKETLPLSFTQDVRADILPMSADGLSTAER